MNQEFGDAPVLAHVAELIASLEEKGIKPSPLEDDDEEEDNGDGWEDEGSDEDVEMS